MAEPLKNRFDRPLVELLAERFTEVHPDFRSKLWSAEQEAANAGRDDRLLAESMVEHGDLGFSVDEMQAIITDDEVNRLY